MTGRSSAVSLPICLRTAVSSPFLPSSLTRSSSRAAGVDASSRAAIAWERMLSSCCFMFFPPKNEKTFRSRTGTKGNASAVPPAFSPLKTARFRTQPCPRWITASPVRPYSHTVFRRRLPGESPTLHASGFHHPALAVYAKPTQGSPITAFSYLPNSNTIKCNLQALFLFSLTNRKERDMLFSNTI